MLDADHMSPSTPLFRQFGITNVDHRIKYHKYLLKHNIVKGLAPKYLIDKFNYVSTNHTYLIRSKKAKMFVVQNPKLNFTENLLNIPVQFYGMNYPVHYVIFQRQIALNIKSSSI